MRLIKNGLVALLCVAALLVAQPARSVPTTTTGGGTVLLGGTVVLVLFLAKIGPFEEKDAGSKPAGHVQLSAEERARVAGVYLRELGPSLTEAVATGRGPLINDWARALKLPEGHDARFAKLVHQHRGELLELTQLDRLTDARAARFFERLGELVNADPVLSRDMDALRASLG